MVNLNLKTCTGCRACEDICAKKAISFNYDDEGFLSPHIDEKRCVECGMCEKICPNNHELFYNDISEVYGMKYVLNDKVLKLSASGGAFVALAEYVLNSQGVVFGAAYDKNIDVSHIYIEKKEELYRLQGSKYIQSDTQKTYSQTKNFLESGRLVLYSGTPCQIAGLRAYLNKEFENLITVDLICHGVPSPLSFRKYKIWLENKYKSKIVTYDFRNKDLFGWGNAYSLKLTLENGVKYLKVMRDPYFNNFIKNNSYRNCCYECIYSTNKRCGDFTIGDFWGVDKKYPEFNDNKGVSAVLINNAKAEKIVKELNKSMDVIKVSFKDVSTYNSNLVLPASKPLYRNQIYKNISDLSPIDYVNKRLVKSITVKEKIISLIPVSFKTKVKKILR